MDITAGFEESQDATGVQSSHLWLKWGNNSALLPIFSLFEAFFACFLMESRSIGLSELKNTIKM